MGFFFVVVVVVVIILLLLLLFLFFFLTSVYVFNIVPCGIQMNNTFTVVL